MSWFSEYVVDPIRALIEAAKSNPVEEIVKLAHAAAPIYTAGGPAGLAVAVVTSLEGSLTAAVDSTVASVVGKIGPDGQMLEAAAVTAANDALSFLESHAIGVINGLFAHARTAVASQVVASGG